MSIVSWLLDLLYPPKCVVCRRLLTGKGPVCPRCMDALPEFDGAAPAVRFTSGGAVSFFYEGQLRESFLRFKFGGSAFYAQTYGAWMAHTIRDKLAGKYDVLTWAPVSRARKRKRGYDQSALLCREIGIHLRLESMQTLRKIKDSPAQSTLTDAAQRRANVSGAYRAERPECFAGKRVLIIDDIVMTGATLAECSRTLLQAGASDVVYAAFAAPRKQD